jgi:heme-degrading monooxygenase HmoA
MQVQRSLEQPHRYRLIVDWDTVEDHLVGFRSSEDFARWRGLVGPFFTSSPEVEHTTRLDLGFPSLSG